MLTRQNGRSGTSPRASCSPPRACIGRFVVGLWIQRSSCGRSLSALRSIAACGLGDELASRLLLPGLLAWVLDDRVRAGEHQGGVTVVESHQVGRLPARSADLDDLACPLRMAHDIGVHVEPVPDDCLHAPTSLSAFAHCMSAFPALPARRKNTLTVYPDWHGQASTVTLLAGTGPARREQCGARRWVKEFSGVRCLPAFQVPGAALSCRRRGAGGACAGMREQ